MKLESGNATVERNSAFEEETTFTMEASGLAFDAIASSLYKNSVRAIVREVGTNAADSHVFADEESEAAGKKTDFANKPFEVFLPNEDNPWFAIRDFGIGLTPDKIKTVYTVVFKSDKRHSNNLTGCLGLGSKSPFSYTDQFTVTSWTGGVKRVYTAFKNEKGIPTLALMHEEPSKEPRGVEVKFSVKNADFFKFRQEAINVYKWFKVKPVVHGLDTDDLETSEVVLKGHKWALTSNKGSVVVMMGNVAYPLNVSDLSTEFQASLHPLSREMLTLGPIIYVDIGDVDITVSRESLKFTDKTYKVIRERLAEVVRGCREEIKKQLAACTRLHDARMLLLDLKTNGHLAGIINKEGAEWRGQPVSLVVNLPFLRDKTADEIAADNEREKKFGTKKKVGDDKPTPTLDNLRARVVELFMKGNEDEDEEGLSQQEAEEQVEDMEVTDLVDHLPEDEQAAYAPYLGPVDPTATEEPENSVFGDDNEGVESIHTELPSLFNEDPKKKIQHRAHAMKLIFEDKYRRRKPTERVINGVKITQFTISRGLHIVVNDFGPGANKRIIHWSRMQSIYNSNHNPVVKFTPAIGYDINKLIEEEDLGDFVTLVSDMEDPPPPPRPEKKKKVPQILVHNGGYDRSDWDEMTVEDDGKQEFVYVRVHKFEIVGGKGNLGVEKPHEMSEFLQKEVGSLMKDLAWYGVRNRAQRRIGKAKNWITFEEYVQRFIDRNKRLMERASKYLLWQSLDLQNADLVRTFHSDDRLPPNHIVRKLAEMLNDLRTDSVGLEVQHFLALRRVVRFEPPKLDAVEAECKKLDAMITAKYPLIQIVDSRHLDRKYATHMVHYMTIMDRTRVKPPEPVTS